MQKYYVIIAETTIISIFVPLTALRKYSNTVK